MIYLIFRIFTVVLWIIVFYLYFSDPKKAILITLFSRMLLFNIIIGPRSLLEDIPIFQFGTTSVLFLDGFIFGLIIYFIVVHGKVILLHSLKSKVIIRPFSLLFIWISFETLIGIINHGESSIRAASTYLIPILFVFIIPRLFRDKIDLYRFLLILFYMMIISIIVNFFYFYGFGVRGIAHLSGDWRSGYRFIGSHQVIIAGITTIALIIFPSSTNFSKIFNFVGAIISLGALIYTQYRTVWFAFLIGIIFLVNILIRTNSIQKKHLAWGSIIVFTLLLGISFSSIVFNQEFLNSFQASIGHLFSWESLKSDTTLSIRIDLWTKYWPLIRTHLLFGRGLGEYVVINQANLSYTTMMHNDLLAYLFYFGIVGVILLLFPLAKWFLSMRKHLRYSDCIRSTSIGLILLIGVIMLFVFGIFFLFIEWFWLLIGFGYAFIEIRNKEYLVCNTNL